MPRKPGCHTTGAAGEKMIEAKAQMGHGEFKPWIERNFSLSFNRASIYMNFASATSGKQKSRIGDFSSLNDFAKATGHSSYKATPVTAQPWHEPVKQILGRVDIETLRDAELKRAEERNAERRLALQLIDIGYKALATKLHPDKGGSRGAMARLNHVRDRLVKTHA